MHLSAVFLLVLFFYTHKDNLLLYSSFVVNIIKPFSSVLKPASSLTAVQLFQMQIFVFLSGKYWPCKVSVRKV